LSTGLRSGITNLQGATLNSPERAIIGRPSGSFLITIVGFEINPPGTTENWSSYRYLPRPEFARLSGPRLILSRCFQRSRARLALAASRADSPFDHPCLRSAVPWRRKGSADRESSCHQGRPVWCQEPLGRTEPYESRVAYSSETLRRILRNTPVHEPNMESRMPNGNWDQKTINSEIFSMDTERAMSVNPSKFGTESVRTNKKVEMKWLGKKPSAAILSPSIASPAPTATANISARSDADWQVTRSSPDLKAEQFRLKNVFSQIPVRAPPQAVIMDKSWSPALTEPRALSADSFNEPRTPSKETLEKEAGLSRICGHRDTMDRPGGRCDPVLRRLVRNFESIGIGGQPSCDSALGG